MFTEQTLILTTRQGKRAAAAYAFGAVLVLLVAASALVLLGRSIDIPNDPSLSAWLELVIGVAMLAAALVLYRLGDRPARRRDKPLTIGAAGALFFGVFSMVTNYKALAMMIPAAKVIVTRSEVLPERIILTLVLVLIASSPAWIPVVLAAVAPGRVDRVLGAIRRFLERYGHRILIVLLAVLGLFLTARGTVIVTGL